MSTTKSSPPGDGRGGLEATPSGNGRGDSRLQQNSRCRAMGGDLRPHWKLSPSGDERGVFNVKNNVISATGLWGGGPNIHNKT